MKITIEYRRLRPHVLLTGLVLFWAAGCAVKPPPEPVVEAPAERPVLTVLSKAEYPDFSDDMDFDELDRGIGQSLVYLKRIPPDRAISFGSDRYSARHVRDSLERFLTFIRTTPDRDRLNRFIREHYTVYQSRGRTPDGDVLFTGYFEPIYEGSLEPSAGFPVPAYGLPRDLIKVDLSLFSESWKGRQLVGRVENNRLVPYFDREQIVRRGPGPDFPAVAWLKDPIDLYFLQIQGSGRIRTPDGREIGLLYAGKNGLPARLIGRRLIEDGRISREEMSMQRIRQYLNRHPQEIAPRINQDPSYVFFRISDTGPLGSLGVEVIPGRSIATDREVFPPAALAFIETEKPLVRETRQIGEWAPLHRFVLNQDTGGAIKGPGRVDLFWGSGPYAETAAGHMKHTGRLYLLVLTSPETAR
ncbi:MAG: murein transglycosylase A [Desulfobacterales bacterium]